MIFNKIGILEYGSLIDDPGIEILPLIVDTIDCETPFGVEFSRISKTRDFAPTLIPVSDADGLCVRAKILVLCDKINIEEAKSLLWRREARIKDFNRKYTEPEKITANSIVIETLKKFHGIDSVLYTSIQSNMGLFTYPSILAHFAIESILSGAGNDGKDGVRYLLNSKKNGIVTKNSNEFEKEILKQTQCESLELAIEKLDLLRPHHISIKVDMHNFEKEVTDITDLVCEYGLKTTFGSGYVSEDKIREELKNNKEIFISNCHTGFKMAQEKILTLLLEIQDKVIDNKANLKKYREEKKLTELGYIKTEISRLHFKESVLRHIMDSIVWQIIRGQLYISRRLYKEVEGDKILKHSNIGSVVGVAKSINQKPGDVAIITDLTSYIQTGDLLCIIGNKVVIGEVKEGNRNLEILEVLEEVVKGDAPTSEILEKYPLNDKSLKQLNRQLKQHESMQNLANLINNDEGVDLQTGKPIKIITPHEDTPRYIQELAKLREQLKKNNLFAYLVIDNCLHIGMYKGPFRFMGRNILQNLGKHYTENYIEIDLLGVIEALNKPIFFLPFEKEFIFDILFGRVKILFLLDLDSYLNLYKAYGFKAEFASRKETMKAIESGSKGLFMIKNRGIKITNETEEVMWLAHGTFLRIFFEQMYPSYIAYSCKYYFM